MLANQMLMTKKQLLRFNVKLLVSWIILSVLCFYWGKPLVNSMLPYLTTINDMIAPSYSSSLKIIDSDGGGLLQLTAYVVKKIYLASNNIIFPGSKMTATIDVMHILVPMTILFSLLLAWPLNNWKAKLLVLFSGIPVTFAILGMTAPVLLAGKLDVMLLERAAASGVKNPEPFTVTWMIFTESGGDWLLPIAAAIICIYAVKRLEFMFRIFQISHATN